MTLHTIEINLNLTLESPLHVGTGYGLSGFLDAIYVTDAQGYPYIPGSTMKGRLRHYLTNMLSTLGGNEATLRNLFGDEKQAGSLYFENFPLSQEWQNLIARSHPHSAMTGLGRNGVDLLSQKRINVMLSRLRGVALERRLFSVETAPRHLTFAGRVHGRIEDDGRFAGQFPQDVVLLAAAIRALTHIGGRKSRGLGRARLAPDRDLLLDNGAVSLDTLLEALA